MINITGSHPCYQVWDFKHLIGYAPFQTTPGCILAYALKVMKIIQSKLCMSSMTSAKYVCFCKVILLVFFLVVWCYWFCVQNLMPINTCMIGLYTCRFSETRLAEIYMFRRKQTVNMPICTMTLIYAQFRITFLVRFIQWIYWFLQSGRVVLSQWLSIWDRQVREQTRNESEKKKANNKAFR